MPKRILSAIITILICLNVCIPAYAFEPAGFTVSAEAGMLVSLDTGETLYEKNIDKKMYPASLTKIMTVTLMLESPSFDPNAKVSMNAEVDRYITGTGSAVSTLKAGEEITQLDLLYYVLMSSAGDCAYLAAMTYGGTVENFVDMMNEKAAQLGLSGTHYSNPVGLHSEDTYTTVRDVRTLTEYALKNETFATACGSSRYKVAATNMSGERTLSTTNFMLDSTTNYYYSYTTGVKTGFTNEAGRCLVSTASYNGYNYLCILMKCPTNTGRREEFIESKELYRWAFNNFEYKKVADSINPVCEIEVELSFDTDHLPLYLEEGFVTVLPTDADTSTIKIEPHPTASSVDAPIKKGDRLGTADIIYAERVIGTVNLVARDNVKQSGLLKVLRSVKRFFSSSGMKIVYCLIAAAIIVFIAAVIKMNSGRGKKRSRKVKYIPYDEKRENPRK